MSKPYVVLPGVVRFSKLMLKVIVLAVLVIYSLKNLIGSYMDNLYYSVESTQASPDGSFFVTQLSSLRESGHAPYGHLLVLSKSGPVKTPDEGHVVFAGYCTLHDLSYSWVNNQHLLVQCASTKQAPVASLAIKSHGIEITLDQSKTQPNAMSDT
ncbi:hypothetical protein [Marinobacterium weihaiense]|uniref:Uncharacterized protein n=1 Tax=Marinobacterium weihaiense TaxID=2851016 RepID=A0ABS6MEZ4_9GAMM|nr:hypothetical protein [Marinobacterium weihaiense]MBV0934838.1 hypothetical protein [Marinobacterium weihaiense]